jgi:hypothetical protein
MGRPRKRRAADSPEDQQVDANGNPLDANFSFLEQDQSNFEFLDLLSPSYALPDVNNHYQPTSHPASEADRFPAGHFQFGGVDLLGRIDFAESDSADEEVARDIHDTFSRYMAGQIPDRLPGLSPGYSATPESTPSPRAYPNATCTCLSTMYLAMESLANMPQSATAAMKLARGACKVAHNVIHCSSCSLPLLEDPTVQPPMQSFQNMMLLGGFIPTIANAYARILDMIDAETALAKKEGRTSHFTFKECGGLWGKLGEEEPRCGILRTFDNKELEPDEWRLAIRGLLKIDIYGLSFSKSESSIPFVKVNHLGLKDIIDALEERSRLRHAKVDELIEAGTITPESHGYLMPAASEGKWKKDSGQKHNCQQIVEMARLSLDKLVIA